MKLVCPQCQYMKELDDAVVPAEMVYATCPNCRHRFRFRGEEPQFGLEAEDDSTFAPSVDEGAISHDGQNLMRGAEDGTHREGGEMAHGTSGATGASGMASERAPVQGAGQETGQAAAFSAGHGEAVDPAVANIPWVYRGQVGWLAAFLATTRAVLMTPAVFFAHAGTEWRKAGVFPFYIICTVFGLLMGQIWAWAITTFLSDILSAETMAVAGGGFMGWGMALGMAAVTAVLSPLFLLITAGVLHACLRITGAGRNGFGATAMVCGFGVCTYVLYLVPFIGQFLAGLWGLFVLLVGLRHAHGAPMWKVVLAVFLPVLILLVLALVVGGMPH
ncbi:hypothetical protein DSM101010T_01760 [Desulfovibrio subterraneus]|uniref:Yip1 domain-containing protein n=2 Tax=Desulfovibrio subterraneus TaxID=2718620 RepID=A0A7J0BF58_9BACT|nr:hypothetical protein DSM101010T_01760 [Desulfovibrio subterraneus]